MITYRFQTHFGFYTPFNEHMLAWPISIQKAISGLNIPWAGFWTFTYAHINTYSHIYIDIDKCIITQLEIHIHATVQDQRMGSGIEAPCSSKALEHHVYT